MKDDIVSRYAGQHATGSHEHEAETEDDYYTEDEHLYRAFRMGKMGRGETRLKFYHQSGMITLMTYAYLVEVVCASHQALALIFTNCVITLKGRNLTPLLDVLQDSKVRSLYCYDARKYPEPEAHEPVIYQMARQTLQDAVQGLHD